MLDLLIMLIIFALLPGPLLAHRLFLDRKRQTEFTEIANRLRMTLEAEMSTLSPYTAAPYADLALLEAHFSRLCRGKYRRAIQEYGVARHSQNLRRDAAGLVHYIDGDKVKRTIEQLLPFLGRR